MAETLQTEKERLDDVFSYHAPKEGQPDKYEALRAVAKLFAERVLLVVPPSADRSAAIRKIREALMTANAAIALEGRNL